MNATVANPMVAKYDVAGPRYTSYPTVPYWDATPSAAQWIERIGGALGQAGEHGAAIYLHIPFCRALCTFCGCNTRITRSHGFVAPYIESVLAELDLYRAQLGLPLLEFGELHFGGGTPTFLTTEELESLLSGLFRRVAPRAGAIASITQRTSFLGVTGRGCAGRRTSRRRAAGCAGEARRETPGAHSRVGARGRQAPRTAVKRRPDRS